MWNKVAMDTVVSSVAPVGSLWTHLNDPATGIRHNLDQEVNHIVGGVNSLVTRASDAQVNLVARNSDVAVRKSNFDAAESAWRGMPTKNPADIAAKVAQKLIVDAEAGNLSAARQAQAQAEEMYRRLARELMNKKDLLARLNSIEQFREEMERLSNAMHAATVAAPPHPTNILSEQLISLGKNLDLLLYPETKSGSTDKIAEIQKINNRTDIDEKTRIDLINNLLANAA